MSCFWIVIHLLFQVFNVEINFKFMRRIIYSEQDKFSQEYWLISIKYNAVQGKLDKQKIIFIDEQFLSVSIVLLSFSIFSDCICSAWFISIYNLLYPTFAPPPFIILLYFINCEFWRTIGNTLWQSVHSFIV